MVRLGNRPSLELFSITAKEDAKRFLNIFKLMELISVILINTAPRGHGFSSMNHTETTFYTQLQEDALVDRIRNNHNGSSIHQSE